MTRPSECPSCGEPLRRERVPLTAKEMILLAGIAAVIGAAVVHIRQADAIGHGVSDLLFAGIILFPFAFLLPFWIRAHLQRSIPRCTRCTLRWSPSSILSMEPVHPVAVLLAMLFVVLQYFVIAMLPSDSFSWAHLLVVEAFILVLAGIAVAHARGKGSGVLTLRRPHPLVALLALLFVGIQGLAIACSRFEIGHWLPFLIIEAVLFVGLGSILAYATRPVRKRKRPFLSLKSFLVMVIVATLFSWMSFRERTVEDELVARGFPLTHWFQGYGRVTTLDPVTRKPIREVVYTSKDLELWMVNKLLANIAIHLALAVLIGVASERLLFGRQRDDP